MISENLICLVTLWVRLADCLRVILSFSTEMVARGAEQERASEVAAMMMASSKTFVAEPPFIRDDPDMGSGPMIGFRITARGIRGKGGREGGSDPLWKISIKKLLFFSMKASLRYKASLLQQLAGKL